ncbi:hypothetical protein RXV94_09300 [Yeosuana sp. MJ-SS3]|uniref:Arginyl-tRNA synthetase n=1 Tax=Gilvirhabdus luticola TaxID=3079858 RepID=A0ABU3U7H4_9FLAO|nr:hypothetical protein [Yeosuana sp. MJ-SS3]MDU8886354.1 hypothetical protein [Yeosuana sp. MJ-SS3]
MILDTTHYNKDYKVIIEDLIGKSFSFFESIKMKGIGSKRMIIEDVSPNLNLFINSVSDINYANIELRPDGIIIHINKGHKNYSWIIPYYQLVIYKTNGTSIHAQGKYIHFLNNKMLKENRMFFKKLLENKIKNDFKYDVYNFQNTK